ncbi:MAG: hypothetical protein WBN75_09165 [Verrucomicrobiia bacterium]
MSEATAQKFDPADPDRPVKAFLQEYQTLFGFGLEALDDLEGKKAPSRGLGAW